MPNESDARLKTFALLIKFGHDLFAHKDLRGMAAAAVNDSRALLGFRSSAVFKLQEDKTCDILGQFAQTAVNEHSAAALLQKKLVSETDFSSSCTVQLHNEDLPQELAENHAEYLLCKLQPPAAARICGAYVWLLEFDKEIPPQVVTTAQLVGKSIAESLSLAESAAAGSWKVTRHSGKVLKLSFLALLLAAVMCIPVRESSTAEFMLKSPDITAAYAWFDGPVKQCLKQDGDPVRKGEIIIQFDTAALEYRLASARAALKEAEAEFELAQQNAFTDESKSGQAKLLQAKCNTLKVAVDEAKWFFNHTQIKAPADGILALTDGRAEQLTGKAVRAGEKLFEVFGGKGMIAEIMVHERDSSILQENFDAELFLHTAPEKSIRGKILSTAQYPVLNDQSQYCYPVRVDLPETDQKELRFGMRGIAKLSGGKVCLGYYLFKNMILYIRNW